MCPEHEWPRECDRWTHDSASRYEVSQRVRKRIEEIFGWLKTVGLLRKTRHRRGQSQLVFVFATAIYNLIRIRTLRAVLA